MPFDSYNTLLEGVGEILSAEKDLGAQAEGFFDRLSGDLSLDPSLVYLMLRFRRSMPILESIPELPWTHYEYSGIQAITNVPPLGLPLLTNHD